MKAIRMNNEVIVVLENVKNVSLHTNGTGAKSNPYYYFIRIEYMNGQSASSPTTEDKSQVLFWFNTIFTIITAE